MDWVLDPDIDFLNHGSFGAAPEPVLAAQDRIRRRMEADPVRFFQRDLEELLDSARARLGGFLGAAPNDLVFVTNATTGVNAVLRSLTFSPGDELLVTDHAYNACRNAVDFVAGRAGAEVVVARVPFPLSDPGEVTAAITAAVTDRTRLALIDHVTSPTALVFPIADIVAELEGRGVDTLVDGAHGPGQVPVDLDRLGAAYYSGNCHKWVSAPKGAGFLWIRPDRHDGIVPPVISHGANSDRTDRPRLHLLFDWMGTDDPSAVLAVPAAIDFLEAAHADGSGGVMGANHLLVVEGRRALLEALEIEEEPSPAAMLAAMAAVPLPPAADPDLPLQDELLAHRFQVPVVAWPRPPQRLIRLSAHLYNTPGQYRRLGAVLRELL